MFDDELKWEVFRSYALEYIRNKEQDILKRWLADIGYKEPIGYYLNYSNNIIEIYSTRPGLLIGRAGVNVDKLRKMLSEEFNGKLEVKFIEIRGGFVCVE